MKDKLKLVVGVCFVFLLIFSVVLVFVTVNPVNATTPIFSSDFEDGNYADWTDANYSSGNNVTVVDANPINGTYHVNASVKASGGSWAYLYKTISDQTTCYLQAYIKIQTNLPSSGEYYHPLALFADGAAGGKAVVYCAVYNDGGTSKWALRYRNGSTLETIVSSSTVSLDTLYCVEIKGVVDNAEGSASLYVNGTEIESISSVDNNYYGNITDVIVGERYSSDTADHSVFFDDVTVLDSYIGTGEGESTEPTCSDLSISTTAAGASCQFNCTISDETALESNGQWQLGNNASGVMTWSSLTNFTTTPETISTSFNLNDTVGNVNAYMLNFTDNEGNSNSTGLLYINSTNPTATYLLCNASALTYAYNTTTINSAATIKALFETDGTLANFALSVDFTGSYVNCSAHLFHGGQTKFGNATTTMPASVSTYHAKIYATTYDGLQNVTDVITITTSGNWTRYMEGHEMTPTALQAIIDEGIAASENASIYMAAKNCSEWSTGGVLTTVNATNGIYLHGAPTERYENGTVIEWRTMLIMADRVEDSGTFFTVEYNSSRPDASFRFSDVMLVGYRYWDYLANGTPEFTIPYTGADGEIHGLEDMYRGIYIYTYDNDTDKVNGIYNVRVDHCNFQDMCLNGVWLDGGGSVSYSHRTVQAVIDHNRLVNSYGDPGYQANSSYANRTLDYGIGIRRWSCSMWEENATDVWGQYNNYTVVIEDNYFSKWRHCVCSNDGMHYVFRYNTVEGDYADGSVDAHGSYADASHLWAVGTRCIEVYNNTFTDPDITWVGEPWAVNLRGGSGLVYNNTLSGYQSVIFIKNEWYAQTYNMTSQVNQTFIWDNYGDFEEIVGWYYNVTEGVNYWLDDPSNQSLSYTPYTYPHPLVEADYAADEVTLDAPTDAYVESTNPKVTFYFTPDFSESNPINATFWSNVTGTWAETQYIGNVTDDTQTSFNYTFTECGTIIWNVGVYTSASTTVFADTNYTLTVNIKETSSESTTRYIIEGSFNVTEDGDVIQSDNGTDTHWKKITIEQLTFSDMPLVKIYIKPNDNSTSTPDNMWRQAGEWLGSQPTAYAVYDEQSVYICFKEVYSETETYFMNGEYKIVVIK